MICTLVKKGMTVCLAMVVRVVGTAVDSVEHSLDLSNLAVAVAVQRTFALVETLCMIE